MAVQGSTWWYKTVHDKFLSRFMAVHDGTWEYIFHYITVYGSTWRYIAVHDWISAGLGGSGQNRPADFGALL